MRRTSRYTARRPRQGSWTGRQDNAQTLTAGTASAFVIWDDATSARLNCPGHLTHRVTYAWIGLRPGAIAAAGRLAWYVYTFKTDGTGALPTAAIWSPLSTATEALEKGVLTWGALTYSPNAANAGSAGLMQFTHKLEVKARRKFEDNDALAIVLEASSTATNGLDLLVRTYCSW